MELKKRLVFAVTLAVMTCSLNLFDFSESKISLTPEQKENLGCFIEAQETLGRKCSLLDLDRKSAFLCSVNGYGSRIVYDFDYRRNLLNGVARNHKMADRRMRSLSRFDTVECSYEYDEENRLTCVSLPYADYRMEYDEDGMLSDQLSDGVKLVSKFYQDGRLAKIDYANGSGFTYLYDDAGHKLSSQRDGQEVYSYEYDGDQLVRKKNVLTGADCRYRSDGENRIASMESSDGLSIRYEYGDSVGDDSPRKRCYDFQGISLTIEPKEDGIHSNRYTSDYLEDISGRTLRRTLRLDSGYGYQETYSYVEEEPTYEELSEDTYEEALADRTDDTKVSRFSNGIHFYEYSYDEADNIVEGQSDAGSFEARYNEFGELTDYSDGSGTYHYVYDGRGNILSNNGISMEYEINHGLDEMISVNGSRVEYDACGNPVIYKGSSLVWQGKNMIRYGHNSYAYNDAGIRTGKIVDGRRTQYYLEGNKVIFEKTEGKEPLAFLYEKNEVIGFLYKEKPFFYAKNVQKDVTDILDDSGCCVVSYRYDPWGKPISVSGPMADTLGKRNPYLFRSYRYDSETGFYYLLTRYYDPETGRFINADDLSNLRYTVLSASSSKNLYAYADNNPLNKIDPHGNMSHTVLNALKVLYSDLHLIDDRYIGPICLVGNAHNPYQGFHETAQLVAAKELSRENYWTELEYPIGRKRADILAFKGANFLYEVKPATYSYDLASKQLKGYLEATGFVVGPPFNESKIDFLDKIEMKVYYDLNGIVRYAFYKERRQWVNVLVYQEVKEEQIQKKLKVAMWVGVGVAAAVILATLVEDIISGGAGICDDIASIQVACGTFRRATAFAMLFV